MVWESMGIGTEDRKMGIEIEFDRCRKVAGNSSQRCYGRHVQVKSGMTSE